MTGWSNGDSFSNGQSMSTTDRTLEPWLFRLLRPVQDRGDI